MPKLPRCLSAPMLLDGFCRADVGLVLDKSDLQLCREAAGSEKQLGNEKRARKVV